MLLYGFPVWALVVSAIFFIFICFFIPKSARAFISAAIRKKGVIMAVRNDLGQVEFRRFKLDPNLGTMQGNPTEYYFIPTPIDKVTPKDRVTGEDNKDLTDSVPIFNELVIKRTIISDCGGVPFFFADKSSSIAMNPELISTMDESLKNNLNEEDKKNYIKLRNPNIIQRFLTMSIGPDRIFSWGRRFEMRGKFKPIPTMKIALSAMTILTIIIVAYIIMSSGILSQFGSMFGGPR